LYLAEASHSDVSFGPLYYLVRFWDDRAFRPKCRVVIVVDGWTT